MSAGGGPPDSVDDHRQTCPVPDDNQLAGCREYPGEVGDRGRHRLGGKNDSWLTVRQ